MTQQDPKDHHYLPVFYLSRWQGPDGRVVRYYRPHNRVIASAITPPNTAFEPRLYTLEGFPEEMQQAVEREYMAPVVDDPAAKALEILITRNCAALTAKVREAWTRFLLSLRECQEFRVRAGIMGKKKNPYAPTQRPEYPRRAA